MTGDTSIKSAAEDRMTVLCIGQAVVDCITRGLEDDPFGRGKTRAQMTPSEGAKHAHRALRSILAATQSTNPLCSLHWDTELV